MLAVGALLLGLLTLTGCNDEPDADPFGDSASGDSAPGDSPSPHDDVQAAEDEEGDDVEETKLTPPDEPEPSIDLTGPVDEIERIYREQDAYRSWLFRHPDPANTERLARITHRDCPCWEAGHELMTRYAQHNHWWTGAKVRIVHFEVLDQASEHLVRLRVTGERNGAATLVDETGEIHSRLPPERRVQEITMRRGTFSRNQPHRDRSGDPWKVITVYDAKVEVLGGRGME